MPELPEKWGLPDPSTMAEIPDFLDFCQAACRRGGEILVRRLGGARVREKHPRDYVTQADIESQQAIESMIHQKFPHHAIVGEEETAQAADRAEPTSPFCWWIDPLDGTTNYIHQLRSFAVSVALSWHGQPIAAAVYDPLLNEMYSAALERDSELNGQPIRTSPQTELDQALVACSFSNQVRRDSPELERFTRILCDTRATVRRLGSAALNLCYVACGRLDAYWATSVNSWDVAAGALILQQAGGTIRHLNGSDFRIAEPQFLATSTKALHASLNPLLDLGSPASPTA